MTRRTLHLAPLFTFALSTYAFAQAPIPAQKPPAARPAANTPAKPGAAAAAKPAAEPAPTTEEIKRLMDEGKHREALQKLSRALALKGDAAKQYDRHELLRTKAEAHLNIKDAAAAASAFAAAAKEAPDEASRAQDKASEIVVKRSKNLVFTPKPGKKGDKAEPVEILDPEKRKAAFAALLEEEQAAAAPGLKAAKASKTLPPIVEALKQISDLRMLELAATGEDAEASKMVDDLSGRAQKLMDEAVQDMAALVKDVETSANDLQPTAVPTRAPGGRGAMLTQTLRRRGLSHKDRQDLQRTIGDLKKLVPMARELAESLGEQGKDFEKVAEDGEVVGNKAHEVLTANYDDDLDMNSRETRLKRPMERRR